jgi:predicted phage tail protein
LSLINIILHGTLKDQYESFEVGADTVADAIEGWSRQTPMAQMPLKDRPIIDVVGFDTVEELHVKTDVKEIHLVPRMFGGKGNFGRILLGAAFIGLSFIPGLGQIGQIAISTILFTAGVGLVIGGIMQMFMKAPTVNNSDDPDPSRYLSAAGNTTAIGTLIPKGYGRFKVGGHYLSVQVNAQDMVFGTFPSTP